MTTRPTNPSDTTDREIVLSRVLHAPRELVWEAWTKPEHVVKWWGPRGFTSVTKRHEFHVGGVWEHTMIGPDGTRFPNKSVFKEIVPLERIVFSHGGGREDAEVPGASFVATWTFEPLEDGTTRLTGRMVFPSAAMRDHVVREFGAIEGGRQTLERLSEQIAAFRCEPFVISREFAASRELVWSAWTEQKHFERWFGPKGFRTHMAKFDLRPGGMTLYSQTTPDGVTLWGRALYREVVPPAKIVWINSFSDPAGGITRHPFTKDPWPLQMLTIITFAENAGKTTVTVTWLPIDATQVEIDTFNAGRESMKGGWGGTFEQLTDYLAGKR
ncbi:MAG TPA: SRPBCC family protein [Opitutus sp.]|nr:SRPBCC family protein [Opitutus sp.]